MAEAAVDALSPWVLLDQAPMIPTVHAVSEEVIALTRRCDVSTSWVDSRDATGSMRARLEAVGAFGDGCVDLGDFADATASEMAQRGFDVRILRLTDSEGGIHITRFGPSDLPQLISAISTVAG